jgi:hypothetical protein
MNACLHARTHTHGSKRAIYSLLLLFTTILYYCAHLTTYLYYASIHHPAAYVRKAKIKP